MQVQTENDGIPVGTARCTKCGEELPNEAFGWFRTRFTKDGWRLRVSLNCIKCCAKKQKIVRDLKKIHSKPSLGTPCAMCGEPMVDGHPKGPMELNHDHANGRFLGYIHKCCNTGLARGSQEDWDKAAAYRARVYAEPTEGVLW